MLTTTDPPYPTPSVLLLGTAPAADDALSLLATTAAPSETSASIVVAWGERQEAFRTAWTRDATNHLSDRKIISPGTTPGTEPVSSVSKPATNVVTTSVAAGGLTGVGAAITDHLTAWTDRDVIVLWYDQVSDFITSVGEEIAF